MTVDHIGGNDLNLLVSLQLLLDTRNVTQAALRAGVTQSAMSRTLARLRRVFEDPLFVRSRGGMEPTATATALAAPTRAALASAHAVFARPAPFDPARATRQLTLAGSDFAALVVLPRLLTRLRQAAPEISVTAVPLPASPAEALDAGSIDLSIGFVGKARPGLRWQLLFEDELVCVGRRGHPAFDRRLTLARYLDAVHLSVTPAAHAADAVDRRLAADGKRRTVAARTAHFLVAPALLRTSDWILTTGARVARDLAALAPLEITAAPIDVGPLRVGQLWHQRSDRDPGHMWFRSRVKDAAGE